MGQITESSSIDQTLLRYLGEKVIGDIRSAEKFDDYFCKAVKGYPVIDYLRQAVVQEDTDAIINLAQSENKERRSLGFLLFQPIIGNPKIINYLHQLWEKAHDYDMKRDLLWRLLDIDGLPIEIHENIYSFIQENWEKFIADSKSWVSGDILDYARERLSNKSFPESKSWIYLCLASISIKRDEVKVLLSQYQDSDASIVARVVKDIKKAKRQL